MFTPNYSHFCERLSPADEKNIPALASRISRTLQFNRFGIAGSAWEVCNDKNAAAAAPSEYAESVAEADLVDFDNLVHTCHYD